MEEKLGTIDMGMTGNPFFTSFSPDVFDLPYLFRDFDHVYKVLEHGGISRRWFQRNLGDRLSECDEQQAPDQDARGSQG